MVRHPIFNSKQARRSRGFGAWARLALAAVALSILPSCGAGDALDEAASSIPSGGSSSSSQKNNWTVVNNSPFTLRVFPGGELKPGQSASGSTYASTITFNIYIKAGNDWVFYKEIKKSAAGTVTIN